MGKRMRGTRQKGACNSEDQISELPNDLIAPILSCLTLKEALRTSIVSKQWRYLWTSVSALNFDANETLDIIAANPELRDVERSKYINFVNHVVKHHRGLTIDEFRICFDLDETSNDDIEGWVQFAMRKEVQWLVLDLSENGESIRKHSQNCTFPLRLVEGMQHCNFGFKSLKSLSLKWVNINGQVFEYLLSNCTVLEHLSIYSSGDLVNVRVAGLSLKLKSLELVFCLGLEKIEICDTNLVSFTYLGPVISLYLNNVPMLKMLYIGEGDSGLKNDIFSQLSCCHSQLEFLTLDMLHPERTMKLPSLSEFSNLKKLVLKIGARADDSLLQFTSLMIKACPYLDRFVLECLAFMTWMMCLKLLEGSGDDEDDDDDDDEDEESTDTPVVNDQSKENTARLEPVEGLTEELPADDTQRTETEVHARTEVPSQTVLPSSAGLQETVDPEFDAELDALLG